jgi:hypothetical protein
LRLRLAIVAAALIAGLMPLPAAVIERGFSTGVYPFLQSGVTAFSNVVPFALFDVLIVTVLAAWLMGGARDLKRRRREGWPRALWQLLTRTSAIAAGLYLLFLTMWGFNYRREPLVGRLRFDEHAVAPAAARELALKSVAAVNEHYAAAHARPAGPGEIPDSLRADFLRAQQALRIASSARPARPKRSILDLYFRWAGVSGMTDPYFLETLVASDVLPIERPFVIAHEWSHLAGFADESEANFLGWLTCVSGSGDAAYSGWLFLYEETVRTLGRDDRREISSRLDPGPREDLRAMAERIRKNVKPVVADAGWRVYDKYLKANRVEAGTASYAEVVRLILGTTFDAGWRPLLK